MMTNSPTNYFPEAGHSFTGVEFTRLEQLPLPHPLQHEYIIQSGLRTDTSLAAALTQFARVWNAFEDPQVGLRTRYSVAQQGFAWAVDPGFALERFQAADYIPLFPTYPRTPPMSRGSTATASQDPRTPGSGVQFPLSPRHGGAPASIPQTEFPSADAVKAARLRLATYGVISSRHHKRIQRSLKNLQSEFNAHLKSNSKWRDNPTFVREFEQALQTVNEAYNRNDRRVRQMLATMPQRIIDSARDAVNRMEAAEQQRQQAAAASAIPIQQQATTVATVAPVVAPTGHTATFNGPPLLPGYPQPLLSTQYGGAPAYYAQNPVMPGQPQQQQQQPHLYPYSTPTAGLAQQQSFSSASISANPSLTGLPAPGTIPPQPQFQQGNSQNANTRHYPPRS